MINVDKNNWHQEVMESKTPVLVDFYATTCGPCRAVAPMLDRLSTSRQDVKFCKIEAGDCPEIFAEHGVGRVPTFILFKEGKEVDRQGGGWWTEKEMNEWISQKGTNS